LAYLLRDVPLVQSCGGTFELYIGGHLMNVNRLLSVPVCITSETKSVPIRVQ